MGLFEPRDGLVDQPAAVGVVERLRKDVRPQPLDDVPGLQPELVLRLVPLPLDVGLHPGPRPLDLDILLFGTKIVSTPELIIPNPRMKERAFVLIPLLELDPFAVEPHSGVKYADAAAGLSPYAQLYWTVTKLDIQNEAAAEFYAEYDKNYTELMKRLNDALIAIGDCERTYFDDEDWYNRYGMPYYLFMRDRYLRK